MAYKTVQTGAKTPFGGHQDGFLIVLYQPLTCLVALMTTGVPSTPPTTETPAQVNASVGIACSTSVRLLDAAFLIGDPCNFNFGIPATCGVEVNA